jgi:hypothetical protein
MNPSFVGCDKGDRSVVERSCSLHLRLFNVNRFFAFSLIGDRIEKKLKIPAIAETVASPNFA